MENGHDNPTNGASSISLLLPIVRSLRGIVLFTVLTGILAAVFVLVVRPKYVATVSLLPANNTSLSLPGLGMLGSMGLGKLDIGSGSMGPDVYVDILRSDRVLTRIAYRPYKPADGSEPRNLVAHYDFASLDSGEALYWTLDRLRTKANISISRVTGLITIRVEDRDPAIAAAVGAAFVDELRDYTQRVYATSAQVKSEFLGTRVAEIGDSLRRAEATLQDFSERNMALGISPRLQIVQQRLATHVEFYRQLILSLNLQYEQARSEAAQQQLIVNVLDEPTPPTVRSWPRRTRTVLLAMIVAVVLGIAWAYAREAFRRQATDREGLAALDDLRAGFVDSFRFRRRRVSR